MDGVDAILDQFLGLAKQEPVTFLAKHAIAAIQRERLDRAAEALRRKMRRGKEGAFRHDRAASLIFDFLRAAEDGVAQQNLEVMADLIANGVAEGGLTEDMIRHLMRMIRDLSYEEMRALAALIRAAKNSPLPAREPGGERDEWMAANQIYEAAWRELTPDAGNWPPHSVSSTFAALQRTGLVAVEVAWGISAYTPTPLLMNLSLLVEVGSFPTARPWASPS